MSQWRWSYFLLCVTCAVYPLALLASAHSLCPGWGDSFNDSLAPYTRECLALLNTPSFTLNVVREDSFWIDDDGGYNFDETNDVETCLTPLYQEGLLDSSLPITHLFIKGNRPLLPAFLVKDFLTNLTLLEHLYWESSVLPAPDFLDTFERQHPDALLHFKFSNNWFSDAQSLLLPGSLAGRKCLHVIEADIEYGGEEEPEHMPALERLIASAPSLKELSLHVEHNGGCLRADGQLYSFMFDQVREDQSFPPLEVLHLNGYDLDAPADGDPQNDYVCIEHMEDDLLTWVSQAWIRLDTWVWQWYNGWLDPGSEGDDREDNMILRNIECSLPKGQRKTNVDRWLDHMDWSQLRTLSLANPSHHTLRMLAPHLSGLKYLSINDTYATSASHFLEKIPGGLTSLSLVDLRDASTERDTDDHSNLAHTYSLTKLWDSIMFKHRLTLQSLTIWSHETLIDQPTSSTQQEEAREGTTQVQAGAYKESMGLLSLLPVPEQWSPHPYFTAWDLGTLKRFQNLSRLDIDVPRAQNTSQPLTSAYEDALSVIPQLQHLTLRFESMEAVQKNSGVVNHECESDINCGTRSPYNQDKSCYSSDTNDTQITKDTLAALLSRIRSNQRINTDHEASLYSSTLGGAEMPGPSEPTLRVLEVFVGQLEGTGKNECGHIREAAAKAMLRRHWLCTVITGTYIAKETGREADLEDEIVCG